ncbi:MAG: homoserine/homoserine lactone efflux protein [Saprospiraceae bacterium]|jgi:homoserine/homoserine lactone efflux protein
MELILWLSFVGTVLIIAFTPGPSVLLAAANSMNHGPKKAIGTIFGDLTANLIQMILSSLGLASIVVSSGEVFDAIKWIGVAYLIYMGMKKLLAKAETQKLKGKKQDKSFRKLYSEGFLMSASNPKAIVFFAALFPLFINENLPFVPQIAILTTTYLVIDGVSLLFYQHFAGKLKGYLEDKEKIHLQNRIVGSLLIFSGIMLSFVRRAND